VDAEAVHWTMHQNTSYVKDENGYPEPASEGTHDPEILEAAQLLLPGGASHGIPNYTRMSHPFKHQARSFWSLG
jgi:hypothetical protein